jgi:long-chain acyl-CoA synthetase
VKKAIKISNAARKIGIDLRKKLFKDVLAAFGGELKYIVCGGAVLDDAIIRDLDAFGITVLNGYGITECSPLVSVNTEKKMRKGSIGVPVPGCQVKIDLTDGLDVGEILVKGDNVMMGYLKNPEATAEVFTEDGWFRTGDVGYMDKDGFIFITGRKKNIIILSNGKNIYPEEIETYISHIPLVNECVVVGRRNDIGEVVITALVYPNPEMAEGKDKSEVYALIKAEINEMNKDLPIFKQVREIEIRDEEFEKNTSHKIKRFKVQ